MSSRRATRGGVVCWCVLGGLLPWVGGIRAADAAVIRLINNDGPSEGFNDPTPVTPVGGNSGTTLGAQRLIAFQRAVDIWAATVDSPVEIRIGATFDPLQCDNNSAILGQAGPSEIFSDFAGAPLPKTFYAAALADRLAGVDLDPDDDDIEAQFNSSLGTTCAMQWYYGLDGAGPASQADLVTVALHELGHGMGFLSYVCFDRSDGCDGVGSRFDDMDDIFSTFLVDDRTSKTFSEMNDGERASAMVATTHLKWKGPQVMAASGQLTVGADSSGRVQMYAPAQLVDGSSVSHWSDVLTPDQLMEPVFTGPNHDIGLAVQALDDMGWNSPLAGTCSGDCNGDGQVTISDLVLEVNIAIGTASLTACPAADVNGDGEVEINEIVGAVANALNGCQGVSAPTPTPSTSTPTPATTPTNTPLTGCPVSFQDDSIDQNLLCLYAGRWSASCGDDQLQASFSSTGTRVAVGIVSDPAIGLFASVTSPRQAVLNYWVPDLSQNTPDFEPLQGTMTLSDDGSMLSIAVDGAPFQVNLCDFVDYEGGFTGIFQDSGGTTNTLRALAQLRARLGQE